MAYLIGQSSMLVTPVILSSLIRGLELTATKAGFLVTLEMLTLALSTLILASLIGKISKKKLFIIGLLLLVLGQIVSSLTDALKLVILGRVLVGLGGGMIVTVANATISSSSDPERLFSIAYITSALLTAIAIIVLTMLSEEYAHTGVFIFIAMIAIIGAPLCKSLFHDSKIESEKLTASATQQPLVYLVLLAIFLYFCVMGSAWAFAEQIALHVGIGNQTIGIIFSGVTLAGLFGGSFAAWLSTRKGRIPPIVVCGVVQVSAVLMLSTSTSTLEYAISLTLSTVSLYFIMPYMIGAAAMFGENGRWGAAGGGASLLGLSLSSSIGGILIDWGGYKMIGIMFGVTGTIAILILVYVITRYSTSSDTR